MRTLRTNDREDIRMASISRLLAAGPWLTVIVWFLAGQWDLADAEARAWLQFSGLICVASLVPLPGTSWTLPALRARVHWWGWIVVLGLVVTS